MNALTFHHEAANRELTFTPGDDGLRVRAVAVPTSDDDGRRVDVVLSLGEAAMIIRYLTDWLDTPPRVETAERQEGVAA